MLQSSASDFFEYLKTLLLSQSWGISSSEYPQTVQHFVFEAGWRSFCAFLPIFLLSLGTLGFYTLLKARRREMKKDFSQLSFFLRMDIKRVRKQAMLAALPKLSLFWGMAAPLIFVLWLLADAFFGFQGLGMLIKNAYSKSDMPLLHGGIFCGFSFACILSACFLFLKSILPRK